MDDRPKTPPHSMFALSAPPRPSLDYPPSFALRLAGRVLRPLGDVFGLTRFGVNLTTLAPGGQSSLHHRHSRQDELIYVLAGEPTLITDSGEVQLHPGMCAGFPAQGTAHHLENRSDHAALILEIGDRTSDDVVEYPRDDLRVTFYPDGTCLFTKKNGRGY